MSVKEHYDNHLGSFYTWMTGNFQDRQLEFQSFLEKNCLHPQSTKSALDLGCGNGIQSVSLAKVGFDVIAVDFSRQLLSEVELNRKELPIKIIEDDIQNVRKYHHARPELIACCGDTISHLDGMDSINRFIADCSSILPLQGKIILSFRDYSIPLCGDSRFIPVRSDDSRILTCCLDFEQARVRVTDILYSRTGNSWIQKVSSYYKVRLIPVQIESVILEQGLNVIYNQIISGMITIIAVKKT